MKLLQEKGMPFTSKQTPVLFRASRSSDLSQLWGLAFALVVALWPMPVWAESYGASTLGHVICNIKDNMRAYPYILNVIAYVMGAFMAVRSFFLFKKHSDNPAQSQVTAGVAHLVGAGFLLSLPSFAGVIQKTVFGDVGGAGKFGCVPTSPSSGASQGLDQMMTGFVQNIYGPIFSLLSLVSIMIGLTFIVGALLRGAKTGTDPRAADPKSIIAHLVFGSILISIGSVLPSMLQSIFGTGEASKMSSITLIQWSKIAGSGANTEAADKATQAVLAFIQIIGGISFVRGWLIMKKAVEGGGQATIPQGLTHVIGGAMAINIDLMVRAIDKTFGTNITTAT